MLLFAVLLLVIAGILTGWRFGAGGRPVGRPDLPTYAHVPIGLFRASREGKLLSCNPFLDAALQAEPGELAGVAIHSLVVDEDVRGRFTEAIRAGAGFSETEVRLRTPKGRIGWFAMAMQLTGAAGSGTYNGFIRPADEGRAIEQGLRAQLKASQAVITASPLAIFSLDARGHVGNVWNLAAERIFGWARDDVKGRLVPILPRGEKTAARSNGSDGAVEVRRWRRDGTPVDVSIVTAPVPDAGPDEDPTVVVAQDITIRRREEEERRRLSEVIEATPDVVAIATLRGDIVYLNPAARERFLGSRPAGQLALPDLHADGWSQRWNAEILPALLNRGSWRGEMLMKRADGFSSISQVIVCHSSPEGRLSYVTLIGRDVSQQRAVEEQLRQSQKLEALGQLTGGIAHDFNNLLTVVRANTEVLRDQLAEMDARQLLNEIETATERGRDLIRRLMVFSRQDELRIRPIKPGEELRGYARTLQRLLPAIVQVVWREGTDLPSINADTGALEQILLNLATNARDAMPNGGRLEVSVDNVTLSPAELASHGWDNARAVAIRVTDTGTGIPPEAIKRIFEPFYTTKESGKGTGLGLPMVCGLVEQLGGAISVSSRVGEGTTFQLLFAACDTGVAAPEGLQPDHAAEMAGHETILLVEDEAAIRRVGVRTLENLGYVVFAAEDGQAALELLNEHAAVDLIVSDIVMPRMGGPALMREARANGIIAPFLFMSGYDERETRSSAGLDSSVPVLQKPWTRAELAGKIRAALTTARQAG